MKTQFFPKILIVYFLCCLPAMANNKELEMLYPAVVSNFLVSKSCEPIEGFYERINVTMAPFDMKRASYFAAVCKMTVNNDIQYKLFVKSKNNLGCLSDVTLNQKVGGVKIDKVSNKNDVYFNYLVSTDNTEYQVEKGTETVLVEDGFGGFLEFTCSGENVLFRAFA